MGKDTKTDDSAKQTPLKRGAKAGADAAKDLTNPSEKSKESGKDETAKADEAATDTDKEPANAAKKKGIFDSIQKFLSGFSQEGGIGKVLGGLLGLGGAWFAGNFFGGGILSTILTIAFSLPLMFIGSDSIGGWINGLLGQPKVKSSTAQAGNQQTADGPSASQQQTPGQEQTQAQTTATEPGSLTLTNEELQALVGPQNGQPDNNLRDRIMFLIDPKDPERHLKVQAVADSIADGPGVIALSQLRQLAQSTISGQQVAAIVFTPISKGSDTVLALAARPTGNPVATPSR